MKEFFKEYVHTIAMVIIGLIFGISFYYLLINAFHASSLDKVVYVNTSDVVYQNYRDNLALIKANLNNYRFNKDKFNYDITKMQKIYSEINYCYSVLNSEESLGGYQSGDYVRYIDVYNLNNYFINSVIDKCFISNLSFIESENMANSWLKERYIVSSLTIDVLSDNTAYLKDELRDNSSYYYNTAVSNSMIRNDLSSSYNMVLNNYNSFSKVILELSEYLVRGDLNE